MPGILIIALLIIGVLYLVGFSFWAAVTICALVFGMFFFLVWLADEELIKRWHVVVFLAVCFVGNRSCAYVVSEKQLHQPLSVMPGAQVKPILSPENFPSISNLDETQFDIAADGSLLFRSGEQLIACTTSDIEPSLGVLAEEEGLSGFILDSGGTLLTMNRGVLGQFNPSQKVPPLSRQNQPPQFDLSQGPPMAFIQTIPGRGIPSRGPVGPIGGTGGYRGGGGGGYSGYESRTTISDAFFWFFKPGDDAVSESVAGPPPPLSDGAQNYAVVVHAPPQIPNYPQPLQLLPDPEMRLARGGEAGQVLVFGGQNTAFARELHRIYSDGSAQWVLNAFAPIRFAAEGHGQLYVVTLPAPGPGEEQSMQHWSIIHLPLGTKEVNQPELVLNSTKLPGDTRIQSFALSESGKTLFFSVPNRVFAIHGPLVVKVLDGISGILRTHGDTLYVFNARRKALLAVTGFE